MTKEPTIEPIGIGATGHSALPERALEDRYAEQELLGEGGTGVVALHQDEWIRRPVAVKVLRTALRSSRRLRAQFLREAQIQGQLEHPSVVPIYDLGADEQGHPYFTMRRVAGDTLESAITREAQGARADYDPRRALAVFAQVCLAVHYAHLRGVVHRDLKPTNIMMGAFGEVYVLDWGAARLDGDEPSRAPIGTPGYMAPEQLGGEAGPAADIYALGATLFEILTGDNPHRGQGAAELIESAQRGVQDHARQALDASGAPPELAALCIQALALDPTKRPKNARTVHDAVERYLAGERDQELRRRLSAAHAARAGELVRVLDQMPGIEGRRKAMGEVGRALALDSTNADALEVMIELLGSPPADIPAEVSLKAQSDYRFRLRHAARFAAIAYLCMLGFLPLVLAAGVTQPLPFVVFFGSCVISAFLGFQVARTGSEQLAIVCMCTSTVGTVATGWIYGPMMIMPSAVIINLMLFCFVLRARAAIFGTIVSLLLVAVPFVLEFMGISQAYVVRGSMVTIAEQSLTVTRPMMLSLGAAATLFGLVGGAGAAAFYHRRLSTMEEAMILREWHLRQLIGGADARPTEPQTAT